MSFNVDQKTYKFILNPEAGKGRGAKIEAALLRFLTQLKLRFEYSRTKEPLHATEIAAAAKNSFDVVVAVGGDGTVNEVASGLVGAKAALGVITVGSGNDFAKMLNVPHSLPDSIHHLHHGVERHFDAGQIELLSSSENTPKQKYFFNTLGIGFDAAVANQVGAIRWLKGMPLYAAALVKSIFSFKPSSFSITSDALKLQSDCYLICVGNGTWEGGGFALTPHAKPDDRKFEVCIIKGKSLRRALGVVPMILKGTHGESSDVELIDADDITIASDTAFPVHADGEMLGLSVIRVRAKILPHALRVIVPENSKH